MENDTIKIIIIFLFNVIVDKVYPVNIIYCEVILTEFGSDEIYCLRSFYYLT